jgi:tetratricopeptide (TPR) repeat protein
MSNLTESTTSENKAKVFISYSHKDKKWKDMLLSQLGVLEEEGGVSVWSDDQIGVGDEWFLEIKNAIQPATIGICLISADFLNSKFVREFEVPDLLEKREKDGMWLIPIMIKPCLTKAVPWLRRLQIFSKDKPISGKIKNKQEEAFFEIAEKIYDRLEAAKNSEEPLPLPEKPIPSWEKPEKIDIDRLPVTGAELFGRTDELNKLDEFWDSGKTNVVSFVAWGGVGKSTLINKWLKYMCEENYRGANKVFGWSFYSQGTNDKVTSADQFIRTALKWFGDENPDEGSAWDKGKRLGRLIGQGKNLLVLDGMEPLQSGLKEERGKIKDPALEMLLKQLAKKNEGLCVISTREVIRDMNKLGDTYQEIELDQISKEAGRALLRVQGVRGTDEELEAVVEGFGNHALAINLLGSYLHEIPGHSISEAHKIEIFKVDDERSRHPRRVIQAWEQKLGEGPELNVLRVLGLFDRPADEGAVKALRMKPAIKYLTDHIKTEKKYLSALKKLRSLNLIAKESHIDPGDLDAHPIIRQHFAKQLEHDYLESWKEANDRLYQYYKNVTRYEPDVLEEMQPLFFAVAHGCMAGKYEEVFDEIYLARINRYNNYFITKILGAYGTNLAVLAFFYKKKWNKTVVGLKKEEQATVFNSSGMCFRSLGHLREAIELFKSSLKITKTLEDWVSVSIEAGNLSELYLTLGDLNLGKYYALKSVEFADRSGISSEKMINLTVLADAKFQMGRIAEAKKLFIKAEKILKKINPDAPFLSSTWGFKYCDLLLDNNRYKAVFDRAKNALDDSRTLLDFALCRLTFGRAYFLKTLNEKKTDIKKVDQFLNQAVDNLRKAGPLDYLPSGLLARAELYRAQKKWNESQEDLDEVFELSESSGMRLFECDAHLEQARLYLAQGKQEEAIPHVKDARKLIEDTGYHRRDSALAELEKQVA